MTSPAAALRTAFLLAAACAAGGAAAATGAAAPARAAAPEPPARSSLSDSVRVTFLVQAPASTPGNATLWISGNVPELGEWNGAGLRLAARGGGRHAATVALARGTALQFKVTRGGWDTVEKDERGGEIGNHVATATGDDTLRLAVRTWRDQAEPPAASRARTLTGNVVEMAAFSSRFVRERRVWVYLPPGYAADSSARYPVVYFHDGNNVFDAATSFLGVEWGVDETAERLIPTGGLPPFIAVAVANTPDRAAEYTPAADARHGGGRAADYARFLVDELKPRVDSLYRTLPDPAHTAVAGSSLGGLVSLWLGLERPDVFGRVACISPAAWWANRDMVRRAGAAAGPRPGQRTWIDIGTHEGTASAGRAEWLEDARALRDALISRGWREGASLHYEEVAGAAHNEGAWAARIDRVLAFLLAP
ncbi:MAG: carbohydrate esterase [Candidatus Eisenbacteria bacterium]|nr:carbohydrate esterase [Candidatus Eisenbacteria bacterium]